MKWLCYISFGLICFGLGIVFTYWIQGQFVYENIKSFFITGISFAVIVALIYEGLNLFVTLYKERKEEKKSVIINLRKHTDDLLPVLRKWIEEPLTPPTEYLFSLVQQHIVSIDQSLHDMLKGSDGIDNTKSRRNDLQKKIPKYIREAIGKQISTDFPELNIDILEELERALERDLMKKSYTFIVAPDPSTTPSGHVLQSQRKDGSVKDTYLAGKKRNLQTLAKTMNNLQVDPNLQEMIENLEILSNRLRELQDAFRKEIDLIIKKITYAVPEEGGILAGRCEMCIDVKVKWHID